MVVPYRSVERAAEALDLHPTRIRRLIACGQLAAEKGGRAWLIDPTSLERLRVTGRPRGRPLAAAHAWALLWLASGDPRLKAMAATWLQPWAASRVRRAVASSDWRAHLPQLRRRARVLHLRAHPSDLPRLASNPHVIGTGVSAAQAYGFDVVAPGVIEGYVPSDHLGELLDDYLLEPSAQPNAILHVVGEPWPFLPDQRVAPAIAVAVDLAESDESRTRDAGLAYLGRLGTTLPDARA